MKLLLVSFLLFLFLLLFMGGSKPQKRDQETTIINKEELLESNKHVLDSSRKEGLYLEAKVDTLKILTDQLEVKVSKNRSKIDLFINK